MVVELAISVCADIRFLYENGYREPATPVPAQRQTDPPSVPITKLYPGGEYPKGKEEVYTVSLLCMCS